MNGLGPGTPAARPCPKSWQVTPPPVGFIRVGGRLDKASLTDLEKHPAVVPAHHHLATLLVRHYHERIQHEGRYIIVGALRSGGF